MVESAKTSRPGSGLTPSSFSVMTPLAVLALAFSTLPPGMPANAASNKAFHCGLGAGLAATTGRFIVRSAPPGMQTSLQMSQSARAASLASWPAGQSLGT